MSTLLSTRSRTGRPLRNHIWRAVSRREKRGGATKPESTLVPSRASTATSASASSAPKVRRTRARVRLIHIHHAGAFPRRHEFDEFTQEQAIERAWWIIRSIQAGKPFEEFTKYSNDDSGKRGGLQVTEDPVTGEPTEWIRWGDRSYPQTLLDVILEDCAPGEVYGKPVVHGRGVSVVQVLEREP